MEAPPAPEVEEVGEVLGLSDIGQEFVDGEGVKWEEGGGDG